ncbi:MAG: archease [Thaumarchaeota archaeon]|nr:MAG: archease [Nitrososphaerota archaeon]TLX92892.1 MAG: archease [Nitrososphaerota archaeon]
MSGGFRYLEHVTDAYIEAYGDSMEEAFSYAAKGTVNVMFEIKDIQGTSKVDFRIEGVDYYELLFNWLERVHLLITIDNQVISNFELKISKLDSKFQLTGWGMVETIDIKKHGYKIEIKGVTYHEMEILQQGNQFKVKFILDL